MEQGPYRMDSRSIWQARDGLSWKPNYPAIMFGHTSRLKLQKQITAARKPETKRFLIEKTISQLQEDATISQKFDDLDIPEINIRKELADILDRPPILGMPIDAVSQDLKEWAETLRVDVRLWVIRKYAEFGSSNNVLYEIPEEFKPTFDTETEDLGEARSPNFLDVTIADLIAAHLIQAGDILTMSYKPRDIQGNHQTYRATVESDGSLQVDNHIFTSPSYAAIYVIQHAGSSRKTQNGWISWKTLDGKLLSELRDEYARRPAAGDSADSSGKLGS
jgi:hypothetical protein